MTDLYIDHLLLRYEATRAGEERLRATVGQAIELAVAELDAVDLETMSDDAVARLFAEALVMKLERGG